VSEQKHYFQAHAFICTNRRPDGHKRGSCAAKGSEKLRDYMKARAKELGLDGRVRINAAGCLDRCELGPTMVVYPEGVWYTFHSNADIDEILEQHLVGGGRVDRLALAVDQTALRADQQG
jgi:(2Fe-2S) ferredoxin